MPRTIFAFNGDLESRLALYWLVHERGYEVLTLSINLGQEIYLEPLGEVALELGASAAQVRLSIPERSLSKTLSRISRSRPMPRSAAPAGSIFAAERQC